MRRNEFPRFLRQLDHYINRMVQLNGELPAEICLTREQLRAFNTAAKDSPGELTENSYRGIPLRER